VNIVAGLAKVSKKQFFIWDIIGEFLYGVLFVGIGYAFGAQWDIIYGLVQDMVSILLLCVLLFVLIHSAHRYRKKWRR
jgi:membrane protein DedA with SNARE-associated domain